MNTFEHPKIVSRADWLAARKQHLAREKEITRLHDQLLSERRQLPWTKIDKDYRFQSAKGSCSLADLFEGRSQLFVYHFMLGPGWGEGCKSCSFFADHVDGPRQHIERHDVKFCAVSRAPIEEIEAYRKRMGWRFSWVSSHGSDFSFDFGVSFTPEQVAAQSSLYNYGTLPAMLDELPGASIFYQDDDGAIYHTYSAYTRGLDILLGAHNMLDFTPKGRNEGDNIMGWVRRHDEYTGASAGGPVAASV
jgi:predicted dithiol-disulfide oxidoreductase (DUF899 family)